LIETSDGARVAFDGCAFFFSFDKRVQSIADLKLRITFRGASGLVFCSNAEYIFDAMLPETFADPPSLDASASSLESLELSLDSPRVLSLDSLELSLDAATRTCVHENPRPCSLTNQAMQTFA
jgi:hypothetical protein